MKKLLFTVLTLLLASCSTVPAYASLDFTSRGLWGLEDSRMAQEARGSVPRVGTLKRPVRSNTGLLGPIYGKPRAKVVQGWSPEVQEYVNSVTYARMSGSRAKPKRWCGWWMRTQLGGGPSLNVAYNWRHYGSPSSPRVGAVVVWRHHVGMIVGRNSKGWIIRSGNDGGRVRERVRSLKGTIIRA